MTGQDRMPASPEQLDVWLACQREPESDRYNIALDLDQAAGVSLDQALSMFHLDAVVSATDNPAWSTDLVYGDHFIFGTSGLAAGPGYPIVQVPAGAVFDVPLGISFFGTAFSEPKLITLASGYEAFTHARAKNLPKLLPTIPDSSRPEPDLVVPGRGHEDSARRASVRQPRKGEQHHL